jgi:hypothetical protein
MDDATDFGLERVAGGIKKTGKRTITEWFLRGYATVRAGFFQIYFQWMHDQLRGERALENWQRQS